MGSSDDRVKSGAKSRKVADLRWAFVVRGDRAYAPIVARRACGDAARRVASHHLLSHPRRAAPHGPHAGRVAACADGVDRTVAGGGGAG